MPAFDAVLAAAGATSASAGGVRMAMAATLAKRMRVVIIGGLLSIDWRSHHPSDCPVGPVPFGACARAHDGLTMMRGQRGDRGGRSGRGIRSRGRGPRRR